MTEEDGDLARGAAVLQLPVTALTTAAVPKSLRWALAFSEGTASTLQRDEGSGERLSNLVKAHS